jgi:hypothetical protein
VIPAGVPDHCELFAGAEGHRYYKDGYDRLSENISKTKKMKTSRRNFIKTSALIGGGLTVSESLFARVAGGAGSTPEIGICTGIDNYEPAQKAGYAFLEEGVRGFLVPSEPDSVFSPILEKTRKSPVPVTACNSFLPGNMKSVGPDQANE